MKFSIIWFYIENNVYFLFGITFSLPEMPGPESSLRDIDRALNAHATKLYHIGIQQCPKSTLADANERSDY
jgi:hypothetical protein